MIAPRSPAADELVVHESGPADGRDIMFLNARRVGWHDLGGRARAWRVAHASWSVVQLACLAYVWSCVAMRRRDERLWASVAFLVGEGGALVIGRGNCPLGPIQDKWGDPVPFFELILPPRAARAAVPVLAGVSVVGLAGLVLRRPGLVARA
jgi:hypothetical protein